jgi:hypothetical protein
MVTRIGRRLFVPLLASGLLLAASAGSAVAKCEGPNPPEFCKEVVASLDVGGNGTVQAGTRQSLVINVSQGEQTFDAMGVALIFSRDSDGSSLRSVATATSEPGRWTAEVLLPDSGSWIVDAQVVDANGAVYRIPVHTSWGAVLLARPRPTTPVTPVTPPPVTPASPVLPIAIAIGALAAAAVVAFGLRQRTRRGAPAGLAAAATASRSQRPG